MGTMRTIAVYSISGKLMKRAILKKQCVNLRKDLGISTGTYIVKVEAKGASEF